MVLSNYEIIEQRVQRDSVSTEVGAKVGAVCEPQALKLPRPTKISPDAARSSRFFVESTINASRMKRARERESLDDKV